MTLAGEETAAIEATRVAVSDVRANSRKRMQLWLLSHCHQPSVTAQELARAFQVSVRHVHQVFREGGTSFLGSLQHARMSQAAEYLADRSLNEIPVKLLSRRCGYLDFASFSRVFKRHFGTTAAAYRRNKQWERQSQGAAGDLEPCLKATDK